jgi:hypothetical protein
MSVIINSEKDIVVFFQTLGVEVSGFHPDKDFNAYTRPETGAKRFTDKEVELRRSILKQCFDFCNDNGIEIYAIYRSVFDVDAEGRMRGYLPILFKLLEGRTLDWRAINQKLEKEFNKRLEMHKKGKTKVELNFYYTIIEVSNGNKGAVRLLQFFEQLLEELNDQLGPNKHKILDSLYGMFIELDLNFLNYVAELAVLNMLIKSYGYILKQVESPLGNGNSAEFLLDKKDGTAQDMVEVVSIRPKTFPATDQKIIDLIDQKIAEKIGKKTKGDPKYFIFTLVPVFWGSSDELQKVAALIKDGRIKTRPNVFELCGYCTFFTDEENNAIPRFELLSKLFKK